MTKIKVDDLEDFDTSEFLKDDETIIEFLNEIMAEGNAGLLAHALGLVAKAKGMQAMSKKCGFTRTALGKALRKESAPRFDTVTKVYGALGYKLVAQKIEHVGA